MLRTITRQAQQLAKGYGNDAEAKHFWAYENGYQYIKDTQTYAEWYKAYQDPNVDGKSKEYQALQKRANRATARLNDLLEFKRKRGYIPSEQETTQSNEPPNDTPVFSQKDKDIAEMKIWANSNPKNSAGIPLDEDQIRDAIDKFAIRNGLDVNDIEEEVFGS